MEQFSTLTNGIDFTSYIDWKLFHSRLQELVTREVARRVMASRMIHSPREEWYFNEISKELYVYVPPDEKIRARWEPVDVFAPILEQEDRPLGLAAIPIRSMNSLQTKSLKGILALLTVQGAASIIKCPPDQTRFNASIHTCFKDVKSGLTYRLVEDADGCGIWECMPVAPKGTLVQ